MSNLSKDPTLTDHHITSLTSILLLNSQHIPSRSFHPHRSPGWDSSLKAAQHEYKLHFRSWVAAGRPRNANHPAHLAYKEAKRKFHSRLRLHWKLLADKQFASLDFNITDPQRLFFQVRKFTAQHNTPPTQHLVFNDRIYENDSLLEGWAEYFECLSAPSVSPFSAEQLEVVSFYRYIQSPPSGTPDLVSEEVTAIIHSLPLRKSAGPDRLSNKHLKFGSSVLPAVLAVIFNTILLFPIFFR